MIHYISPFRPDKNIGLAINSAISQLNANPEDWIVLTDMDICFLRPDSKLQLENILTETEYDILGPATNRLSSQHQCVLRYESEDVFNNTDMKFHLRVASWLHETNYGQVVPTMEVLAAFCLCFRVSTCQKLGMFAENSIQFDSLFSHNAKKHGLKLGIMSGIYVFHLYRMWADNPIQSVAHLLPVQAVD